MNLYKRASSTLAKLAFMPVPQGGGGEAGMQGMPLEQGQAGGLGAMPPQGPPMAAGDPTGGAPQPGMEGDPAAQGAGQQPPQPQQPQKYSANKDELYERLIAAEKKAAKYKSQLDQNGIVPEEDTPSPQEQVIQPPTVEAPTPDMMQQPPTGAPQAASALPMGGLTAQAAEGLKKAVEKKLKSKPGSSNRSAC